MRARRSGEGERGGGLGEGQGGWGRSEGVEQIGGIEWMFE